jgi:hypothetical protein
MTSASAARGIGLAIISILAWPYLASVTTLVHKMQNNTPQKPNNSAAKNDNWLYKQYRNYIHMQTISLLQRPQLIWFTAVFFRIWNFCDTNCVSINKTIHECNCVTDFGSLSSTVPSLCNHKRQRPHKLSAESPLSTNTPHVIYSDFIVTRNITVFLLF